MKTVIEKCLVFVILLSGYACTVQKPINSINPPNNKDYEVDYLFEHDGVKVYRFYDRGDYIYFTSLKSDVSIISNDSTVIRNYVRPENELGLLKPDSLHKVAK